MMALGDTADIRWWHEYLTQECELRLGEDWHWAWANNAWAVEFLDPRNETLVRLRLRAP